MHPEPNNWDPSRRHLRYFAWLLTLVLIGFTLATDSPPLAWFLRLAAALLFAVGTILPRTFRWLYGAALIMLYPVSGIFKKLAPSLSWPRPSLVWSSLGFADRISLRRRLRPRSSPRRRPRPAPTGALRSFDKL